MTIDKSKMHLSRIDFSIIRKYWVEQDHFKVKNKQIIEHIRYLGSHTNKEENPRSICYGLFQGSDLIGATMLCSWDNKWVRYRTLNVIPELRGHNLGWDLLMNAYLDGWEGLDIFGWVRRSHLKWAEQRGFEVIDEDWTDNHVGMVLASAKVGDDRASSSFEPLEFKGKEFFGVVNEDVF